MSSKFRLIFSLLGNVQFTVYTKWPADPIIDGLSGYQITIVINRTIHSQYKGKYHEKISIYYSSIGLSDCIDI